MYRSHGRLSILTISLLVLVAVMAGMGGVLSQRLSEETRAVARLKEEAARSQAQAAQLESHNQELTEQLGVVQNERKSLSERVAALNAQLASATSDLEQSRVSLDDAKSRNDQLAQERAQLQTELTDAISARDQIKQQAQRLEQENDALQQTAGRVRERMALLERDYQQLADTLVSRGTAPTVDSSAVATTTASVDPSAVNNPPLAIPGAFELPPIVVREDHGDAAVSVRGRLVDVNEPQGFVVVDKGSSEGVRVGTEFEILRGTMTLGRVTVARVRPHLSACDVAHADASGPLQVGDVAVQRGL